MTSSALHRVSSSAVAILLFSFLAINVADAATFTVNCATKKLSTAITSAFATATLGTAHTFNVSGTCNDHLTIPPASRLTINGATGAKLVGDAAVPVITNWGGQVDINNLSISSSQAANEVMIIGNGGWIGLFSSTVSSSTNNVSLHVLENGAAQIENSTVTNAKATTVQIEARGFVWIHATSGHSTTLSNASVSNGRAIACWGGAFGIGTSGTGKVTIGPSKMDGIASRGCHATIGYQSVKSSIRITGAARIGIDSGSGDSYVILNTKIDSNPNTVIQAASSSIEIDNSTIITSRSDSIRSIRNGLIYFNHNAGITSVTGPANTYSCYQGGKMYAEPGFAPTGVTSPGGCLAVGGAITH